MKSQRFSNSLTILNAVLLVGLVTAHVRSLAAAQTALPVLRGRGLEIVDDQGRVRASISVLPENPKAIWKGKPYPETVLLRLITANGKPNVKLGANKSGAGLVIGGDSHPNYVQVLAEDGESTVKLVNNAGIERVIKQ